MNSYCESFANKKINLKIRKKTRNPLKIQDAYSLKFSMNNGLRILILDYLKSSRIRGIYLRLVIK